ncbi:MAG: fimbrial protein [Marinifilaceae bacterium]
MKKNFPIIVLLVCSLCGLYLTSCVDDELMSLATVEEGLPCQMTLNFDVTRAEVVSRAVSSTQDEYNVDSLFIIVFNGQGQKEFGNFYVLGSGDKTQNGEVSTGSVTLNTLSGRDKMVYVIANANEDMYDTSKEELDAIETKEDLKQLITRLVQQTTTRGRTFMMSGSAITDVIQKNTNTVTVPVSRIDARLTFTVTTESGAEYENVAFRPREWRIVNVPTTAALFNADYEDDNIANYFTTDWKSFETANGFGFYMLENKQTPRQNISATLTENEQYALREKQEKRELTPEEKNPDAPEQIYENGAFVYAPSTAPYVEITGMLSYKEGSKFVATEVKYMIHMGYKNKDANDYNTLRNHSYKYKITIQSANSIKVEVTAREEQQPGQEGNYIESTNIRNYDAHYETDGITLTHSDVQSGLSWYARTPFSEGLSTAANKSKDYKWIWFKLNNMTNGVYDDPTNNYMNYTSETYPDDVTLQTVCADRSKLLNVDQLIRLINECKKDNVADYEGDMPNHIMDKEGKVAATVFIDEFYYHSNPVTGEAPVDLWKKFVNRNDRVINILSKTKYSEDGMSVLTEGIISLRQKSIQTMYSVAANGAQKAWGIETVNETGRMVFDDSFTREVNHSNTDPGDLGGYSDKDGYNNTLALWSAARGQIVKDRQTNRLNSTYKDKVRFACMQRNRFTNGVYNPEEVTWYLASINQLTDMWIGEDVYNTDARLYNPDDAPIKATDRGGKYPWDEDFYLCSTVKRTKRTTGWLRPTYYTTDAPTRLWSSEGSSVGAWDKGHEGVSTVYYNYRCVRSLGVDKKNDVNDIYTGLVQLEPGPDYVNGDIRRATQQVNMSYLDAKARRDYKISTSTLGRHNERDATNRTYKGFLVMDNVWNPSGPTYTLEQVITTNRCPAGWRAPNQRELAVMHSRIGSGWDNMVHLSCTEFSLTGGTASERPGFAVTSLNGILYLLNSQGEQGRVRCVKDIDI